jgi:hypothetical protein
LRREYRRGQCIEAGLGELAKVDGTRITIVRAE